MGQIDGQLVGAQLENYTGLPNKGLAPGRMVADVTSPIAAIPSVFDGTQWQRFLTTANFGGLPLVFNAGFTAGVSGNALTLNLLGTNLQSPSITNPVFIPFRDSTSANGDAFSRQVVAPLSITIPSGATLGLFSVVTQYLYLWAVDNAGTVSLAVSGSWRFCNSESIQNITAITSSATGNKVLYGPAALTGKAVRLLARFTVTQTSIGTWAALPTEICQYTGAPFVTPIPEGISFNGLALVPSADFGTYSNLLVPYYRMGNRLVVTAAFITAGTTLNSPDATFALPTGMNIDFREITSVVASSLRLGTFLRLTGTATFYSTSTTAGVLYTDGSTQNLVWLSVSPTSGVFLPNPADNICAAGDGLSFEFSVPIQEWACY